MFSRILEQQTAISAVLLGSAKPDIRKLMLSTSKLTKMKSLVKVLEPFQEVTQKLSGEQYPSLCLTEPILQALQHKYVKEDYDDTALMGGLKVILREQLLERFSNENQCQ